jgi:hypothetical protein
MGGAQSEGCACHGTQSALDDAIEVCLMFRNSIQSLDDGSLFLRRKAVVGAIDFRVPGPNAPRWAQKQLTVLVLLKNAASVANDISGAIFSGETGASRAFPLTSIDVVRDAIVAACPVTSRWPAPA